MVAACGSGPSGPKIAPVEPPPVILAQLVVDAAVPDAPEPTKPTSRLVCEPGTAAMAAPAPEPTWFCARPDGTRHGRFVTLFPDDSIEIAGAYRNGLLDGAWERHFISGAIAEHGTYAAGQKTGHWQQTSPTGAVIGEYDLVAGTGVEKRWYDEGPLYSERGLKAGVPHGNAKIYGPDGAVLVAAHYVNGKLDGNHTFGTRQTMRFEETFVAGVRRGPRQIWQFGLLVADENYDKRGKLDGAYTLWRAPKVMRVQGELEKGRRKGGWVWFDRNNNKEREGAYAEGKKEGPWLEWWENKLTFSGNYTAGKPDGEFSYFDRNGNELGRFDIKDGTGTMLTFHANKKPSSRQHMSQGLQDGIYQELTPRGKVVVEGHYRADLKHGVWKEWTPEGAMTLEQTWKRGKLDGRVKKYVDGKVAMETTYKNGVVFGPYAEYRNGKAVVTGQFIDDRKHGTWTEYGVEGQVVLTATYKAGVLDGPWRQLVDGEVVEGLMVAGRRSGTWTRTDRAGLVRKLTYSTP
jgi:antitoxin component YwqK of YwqJK toxin-antitoxin module